MSCKEIGRITGAHLREGAIMAAIAQASVTITVVAMVTISMATKTMTTVTMAGYHGINVQAWCLVRSRSGC